MEANLRGKAHHLYGPVVPNLKALGKKSMEWDLNDWKWDGDQFSATPLNSVPSDCSGRQFFDAGTSFCPDENGIHLRNELEKRDSEKRRREVVVNEEELENNGPGTLNLKLGGQVYPITEADIEKWEGKFGKKSKVVGFSSNRAVCQVEDCRADLTHAKDYHRRHKVCEAHSKASRALVGNVMQRFCQQCSRFHVLEEFDEGKRSCRRRLAGHNKRRRKTNAENIVNSGLVTDERSSSYLLVSLLRILANMHANSSDQTKDQDFISHLLKNLANSSNGGSTPAPLDNTKNLHAAGTSMGTRNGFQEPLKPNLQHTSPTSSSLGGIEKRTVPTPYAIQGSPENAGRRMKLHDIDLNNVYDDSQDCEENLGTCPVLPINGSDSPDCAPWGYQSRQKSSPPQTSGNSGSLSTLSPSSSSGEAQSRTDRIVFKLFGKDPTNLPPFLRKQILDWLSNSPTDIESYIKPGCIVLTMYLRLQKSTWEEICCDLSSSLTKLLQASEDSFWKVGWVYARVLHHAAFMHNGQVVLDTVLPLRNHKSCSILSIKPIAVSVSKRAQFSVKGFNLSQSSTRLLCALEGKYLAQETSSDGGGDSNMSVDNIDIQCLSFSCSMPNIIGRGFIEVEDQSLNSSFFPFIVAEQDVCSEICTLESSMEITEVPNYQPVESGKSKARDDAMEFVHEMGWLLRRTQLMFGHGPVEPNLGLFPFKRFRWLMEFSVEHDWCAVVKKLLGVVFDGIVDAGDYPSIELALLDMGLLHMAVRRNCRAMVENLLKFVPEGISDRFNGVKLKSVEGGFKFMFRPDATGPGGLTPLHVAASKEGSENVLDALTDDPGLVGIQAWKGARDSTGLTPSDYASLRGYYSYINLVQKKINKISLRREHVVLDIEKVTGTHKSILFASFNTEKDERKQIYQLNCKLCEQKMAYANSRTSLAIYRPAVLSMLAIATVCVCAALLFKSLPKVDYVLEPFRWETLGYGYI